MSSKKNNRVFRHRLPNLSEPGMKFDGLSNHNKTFFQKISNTFKMLQEPYTENQKKQFEFSQIAFHNNSLKKKLSFRRTQKLAKPKQRSMSSTTQQLKQAKKYVKQQRYSFSQMSNKHLRNTDKQFQIIASDLATFSISKILASRDEMANNKPTTLLFQNQQDDIELDIRKNSETSQNLFSDKSDFTKWANKIVGSHGKPYDQYDKKLMQKVKDYRRKENNLNFKSMWK